MTTTAVVVIAAGRGAHLTRLLAGLEAQDRPADDVVVVDLMPCEPDVAAIVAGAGPRVRRITLDDDDNRHGLPLGAGRNRGAAAVESEAIVFLDVDCIPAPDLVRRYSDVVDEHDGTLACGPVRYLREGWQHAAGPPFDVAHLAASSDAPAARPEPPTITVDRNHDLFWSLSFGVQARTWERIGGFDDSYRGYGAEDTDLARRARNLGIDLVWFPGGTAFHQWHPPTRLDPDRIDELVANARRFHDRWGDWPMRGWLRELDQLGEVHFDPAEDVLRRAAHA